jgi:hypothetical protein
MIVVVAALERAFSIRHDDRAIPPMRVTQQAIFGNNCGIKSDRSEVIRNSV